MQTYKNIQLGSLITIRELTVEGSKYCIEANKQVDLPTKQVIHKYLVSEGFVDADYSYSS